MHGFCLCSCGFPCIYMYVHVDTSVTPRTQENQKIPQTMSNTSSRSDVVMCPNWLPDWHKCPGFAIKCLGFPKFPKSSLTVPPNMTLHVSYLGLANWDTSQLLHESSFFPRTPQDTLRYPKMSIAHVCTLRGCLRHCWSFLGCSLFLCISSCVSWTFISEMTS